MARKRRKQAATNDDRPEGLAATEQKKWFRVGLPVIGAAGALAALIAVPQFALSWRDSQKADRVEGLDHEPLVEQAITSDGCLFVNRDTHAVHNVSSTFAMWTTMTDPKARAETKADTFGQPLYDGRAMDTGGIIKPRSPTAAVAPGDSVSSVLTANDRTALAEEVRRQAQCPSCAIVFECNTTHHRADGAAFSERSFAEAKLTASGELVLDFLSPILSSGDPRKMEIIRLIKSQNVDFAKAMVTASKRASTVAATP